jgi:hypothetical protein
MRRSIDTEQARRELDALGPEPDDWAELTVNEKIEFHSERYFAKARLDVSTEAPRQIAAEMAAKALHATQQAAPTSSERYI